MTESPKRIQRKKLYISDAQAERFNARWNKFYVLRFSERTRRYVVSGRAHPTIQSALLASHKLDRKSGGMSFIDVVKPQ